MVSWSLFGEDKACGNHHSGGVAAISVAPDFRLGFFASFCSVFRMFLGFDSSTQSLTAVVIDPACGKIVLQESVNFGADLPQYASPSGFLPGGSGGEVHADPRMWLEALDLLLARIQGMIRLADIRMVAGSGQQHGTVYLDDTFEKRLAALVPGDSLATALVPALTRRTSPIWMDTSTGAECEEIAAAMGGRAEVCRRSGSVAVERFSGPQIRRFYKQCPSDYARTRHIHLVSSFLASVLAGKSVAIDHGDGAGMNLMNLETTRWDQDLLDATAPDLADRLPPLAVATTVQGPIARYFVDAYGFSPDCRCALFTGDNPASLVGMGATVPGNVVISLGTSDTFFAAMPSPVTDPAGYGHVFGNPAGGFMSLICFRNGSLAREALRDQLGMDWKAFDRDSMESTCAAAGANLMLPFFGPEITPRHDFSGPVMRGSDALLDGSEPALRVRALLEGQFLNMRLHSRWMGVRADRIRLTGGASKSDSIAQLVADVFQAPVERLAISNSAGLGAALIAAAAAGEDLVSLQRRFCQADGGTMLSPRPELAERYDSALDQYECLLGTELRSGS